MCLGSKYPDTVPLKRVDAESVAEGMCEIFSRTGIPQELLTYQGSVFMAKPCTKFLGLNTSKQRHITPRQMVAWNAGMHV